MLKGTYLTRLRVDWGRQGLGCWEGRGGVGSGLGGGGPRRPTQKKTGGALPARFAGAKKNGEADDTKMIPK